MKAQFKGISMVFAIALLLALILPVTSQSAQNDQGGVSVFPADSSPYGRTYGEWMASWQQWATGMPYTHHPLFDTADASTGQSGPVWFLGGKFCSLNAPNCGTNNVVRHITIPAGKALFFPIVDTEVSTVETGGGDVNNANAIKDINSLRQLAEQYTNYATIVRLDVDGTSVPLQNFRVRSTAFGFYLPQHDIFTAVGEGTFTPGDYFPGVDDGYYVMLEPLSAGRQHTIHFHAEEPNFSWILDITYFVQVQR